MTDPIRVLSDGGQVLELPTLESDPGIEMGPDRNGVVFLYFREGVGLRIKRFARAAENVGTTGSNVVDFTDLGDVPSDYSGLGGYLVRVKAGEDGLEFVDGTTLFDGAGDAAAAVAAHEAAADPHSGYTLLAGRAGTANNLLLSTTATGTLTGSAAAAGGLDFYATSHATPGRFRWFSNATTERMQLTDAGALLVNKTAPDGSEIFGVDGKVRITNGQVEIDNDRGYVITDNAGTGRVPVGSLAGGASNDLHIGYLTGSSDGSTVNTTTKLNARDATYVTVGESVGITGFACHAMPSADNAYQLGSQTRRWTAGVFSTRLGVKNFNEDEHLVEINTTGLHFGPGGATPPDVTLSRGAANRLDLASGDSFSIGGSVIASGTNVIQVATGTAPTATTADAVVFYSSDISAGHTEPSFYCEGTQVLATGQADSASSVRVKMRINGTEVTLLAI